MQDLQSNIDTILVSVLITTYNSEDTIENTIKNLLNQTHRYLEIIVVDDGSTDNTTKILKTHAEKDERLKIFVIGRVGRGKALNYGLAKCHGKYVAINDADDLSKPERISIQVKFLEENLNVGLVGSSKEIQEENKLWIEPVLTEDKDIRRFFTKGQPIQHSSVIFRKEVLDRVNGYNENIKFLLDRDIFLKIGRISKYHQIDEPLITIYRSEKQYFRNKYNGIERIILSAKYQVKAVDYFKFSPILKISIAIKLLWSIVLELIKKSKTK